MRRHAVLGVLLLLALLVPLAALLLNCGGGGGGSSTGGTSSETTGTGSVAVLLADGPADEYKQILITITEVSLIPEGRSGQPVVIFENPQGLTVDLLDLRDEPFLLTFKKDVPAGLYTKIRLRVSDIQPVGGPCAELDVKLPSGKIDLNPREPFRVVGGGTVSIHLDLDANKSINLHQAGQSGKCIFRPVVFVDIEEGVPVGRCPKILSGTIVSLVKDAGSGQTVGFTMALAHDQGEVDVSVSSATKIFDPNGEIADASELQVGQTVKVRGTFDSSGKLAASLVVIGNVFDVSGEVDGAVNTTTQLFPLTPFTGEALVGQHQFKVAEDTLILADCDTEIGPEAIQAGMTARVFYKQVAVVGGGDELRAVAILLRLKEVRGEITALAPAINGKTASILQKDKTTVNVFIPSNTPIYLEGDGVLTMDYLCVGRNVRVVLDPKKPLQLTANVVYVDPATVAGTVTSVATSTRSLVVDGQSVKVVPGATIIDQRGSADSPVDFGTIGPGDTISCFGLVPCSGVGFDAFVVLITM